MHWGLGNKSDYSVHFDDHEMKLVGITAIGCRKVFANI